MNLRRIKHLGLLLIILGCLCSLADCASTPSSSPDPDIQIGDRQWPSDKSEFVSETSGYTSQSTYNNTSQNRKTQPQSPLDSTQVKTKPESFTEKVRRLLVTVQPYQGTAYTDLPQMIQISNFFIIAGMVTNNFQMFLPIIEYTQMFYFMGFFNIMKGNIGIFYNNFIKAKIDPYRLLSSMFNPTILQQPGLPDPVANAGMNASIFTNLIPDICLIGIATIIYIITKILAVLIKSEMVRKINFAFKSIWNGLVYVESMRFCFFVGLQARFLIFEGFGNIVNVAIMGVVAVVIIGYPIKLGIEIKGFIEDRENTQLMTSIGLIETLDHDKKFEFDCLKYSNMYFPVMNYVRHVIFFSCIGASFDFTKVQIGGTIMALFLYFTIFFNEPPHKQRRHNITNFISNLIMLLLICCVISIDITETVMHPQVSAAISFATLILYLFGLAIHVIMVMVSLVIKIIQRTKENGKKTEIEDVVKEHLEEAKKTEGNKLKRGKKSDRDKGIFGTSSHSERSDMSVEESAKENVEPEPVPLKVKKVKNARIL